MKPPAGIIPKSKDSDIWGLFKYLIGQTLGISVSKLKIIKWVLSIYSNPFFCINNAIPNIHPISAVPGPQCPSYRQDRAFPNIHQTFSIHIGPDAQPILPGSPIQVTETAKYRLAATNLYVDQPELIGDCIMRFEIDYRSLSLAGGGCIL